MNLATVLSWLLQYRYVILFPLVVIEGPIVTILAGFLASLGQLNIFICYPLIVIADVVGDLFMYAQGRWGGKPAVEKWGHHFGIKPQLIVRLEEHFKSHPGKTLMFGKVSHFFGGPVLIAAGMARMKLPQFLWFNFLATLPKSLILLLLGFYFGEAYVKFDKFFTFAGWAAAALIVICAVAYFIISKIGKKYLTEEE
ncbi:MAG: DedA family protein [Minisyncoccia bacterium]|jgi:membrane protein DedA with SNARE-associated domain